MRKKSFTAAKVQQENRSFRIFAIVAIVFLLLIQFRVFINFNKDSNHLDTDNCFEQAPRNTIAGADENQNLRTVVEIQNHPPTIFYCRDDGNGIGEARKIFESVLPEYDWVPVKYKRKWEINRFRGQLIKEGRNNRYDFFLGVLRGSCASSNVMQWIADDFKGNMLYISGENMGDYMPQRMEHKFIIGPMAETDRILPLTYLQMVWYKVFRPLYDIGGKYYNDRAGSNINNNNNNNNNANGTAITTVASPEAMLIDPSLRARGNTDKAFLIYAASNCVEFRERAFEELSKVAPANYLGKCKGTGTDLTNRTRVKNKISLGNWWKNIKFYSNFRFCLVMEHAKEHEYVTEKILMAFLGGCIPIYYGSDMVLDIFHPDSFVYYDIENPQSAIQQIQSLEGNPALYQQMLSRPILRDGENTIAQYFSFSDNIGGGKLKERIRQKLKMGSYKFVALNSTSSQKQ